MTQVAPPPLPTRVVAAVVERRSRTARRRRRRRYVVLWMLLAVVVGAGAFSGGLAARAVGFGFRRGPARSADRLWLRTAASAGRAAAGQLRAGVRDGAGSAGPGAGAVGGHSAGAQGRRRRRGGRTLLRTSRRRPPRRGEGAVAGCERRASAGRLDHHAAVRQERLHRQRAHGAAQAARGQPGDPPRATPDQG